MQLTVVDELDLDPNVDDMIIEVPPISKKDASTNSVPTEDRFGRARWVQTRMCYCLPSRLDSCNITPRDTCPSKGLDKTQRTNGSWLWASNPNFGKPPEEGEQEQSRSPIKPKSPDAVSAEAVIISVANELMEAA